MGETVDAIAVPADDLRVAVAHLETCRPAPPLNLLYRLRALVKVHDTPDLFTPPAEPVRDVIDHHLPDMHSPTGRKMRAKVWPRSGSLRMAMLRLIQAAPGGMTDDDLEVAMHRSHQSVSACRNGLVADGWAQAALHDNGTAVVRRNRHGNEAQVWVVTPAAVRRLRT